MGTPIRTIRARLRSARAILILESCCRRRTRLPQPALGTTVSMSFLLESVSSRQETRRLRPPTWLTVGLAAAPSSRSLLLYLHRHPAGLTGLRTGQSLWPAHWHGACSLATGLTWWTESLVRSTKKPFFLLLRQ